MIVETAYYVSIGKPRGKKFFILFLFVIYFWRKNKKVLAFRKTVRVVWTAFYVAKWSFWKQMFFFQEIFLVFPLFWFLNKNFVAMGNKMSAVLSELHFPCLQECLEEKTFILRKIFHFFFWLDKLRKFRGKIGRGCQSSLLRVQETSWGSFVRRSHHFWLTFGLWLNQSDSAQQFFTRVVYGSIYLFSV